MTIIVDGNGTRWVDDIPRKRRAPARALRFATLKVGDQIMRNWSDGRRQSSVYYRVSDLWFDPVQGQADPTKGMMVGYQSIGFDGEPKGRKQSTTLRGLASQQFHYADIDYVQMCKDRSQAMSGGAVIGIGQGRIIRQRPKTPGQHP